MRLFKLLQRAIVVEEFSVLAESPEEALRKFHECDDDVSYDGCETEKHLGKPIFAEGYEEGVGYEDGREVAP